MRRFAGRRRRFDFGHFKRFVPQRSSSESFSAPNRFSATTRRVRFKAGKIIPNETEPMTIADGARTISLGKHNWEIIKNGVSEIIEVSGDEKLPKPFVCISTGKFEIEPTGALSFGAILENKKI
jgi:threonine dehydratase